jgi:hypothetical protein
VREETVEVAKEKRLIVKEKIIRKDKDLEWGKVNYYQFLGYWVNPLSKCIYEVVRFWSHPMARMEGRYDSAMMKLISYGILFFLLLSLFLRVLGLYPLTYLTFSPLRNISLLLA